LEVVIVTYWESNPYYSPERVGLKIVGMVEFEPDYSFDMFVVWEDKEGLVYMASDSGCSCPSPFEDIRSIEDLERIGSYDQFSRALDSFRGEADSYRGDVVGGSTSVNSLRGKVRRRLAKT
jgi:hypothetical protein